MARLSPTRMWGLLVALSGVTAAGQPQADALSAVEVLRAGGCGGVVPIAPPLRHSLSLDRLAQAWASGDSLSALAARNGYPPGSTAAVHVTVRGSALLEQLGRSDCRALTGPDLHEIGSFQRGADIWWVMSSALAKTVVPSVRVNPSPPPPARVLPSQRQTATSPTALSHRALELVNEARARGARCGQRTFAPAPPMSLSGPLGSVAFGHAADMAEHSYFEHVDLAGRSPADRVRAVGYPEKLVGENIAYGPATVEEVVHGWLDSPGHCENIMDPRFAEMGLAFAAGRGTRHGLYWVQLLAEPRA